MSAFRATQARQADTGVISMENKMLHDIAVKNYQEKGTRCPPEYIFFSRTCTVKVWARMNFDLDASSRARIWARIRIRHGSG
jgi:hypothetical protein